MNFFDALPRGSLFLAVGILFVALALFIGYRRRTIKRRGLKLTAQVLTPEVSSTFRGARVYRTRVRFQAPDGNWVERVSDHGHAKPRRLGDTVDVWYDPNDPTRVAIDEPGTSGIVLLMVAFGLVFIGIGVYEIIHPG